MSRLRWACRRHGPARQGSGAPAAGSHVGAGSVSSLADRIRGVVGRPLPVASGSTVTSRASTGEPQDLSSLQGEWRGDCFVVERRYGASEIYGDQRVAFYAERLAQASAAAALVA